MEGEEIGRIDEGAAPTPDLTVKGVPVWRGLIGRTAQEGLVADLRDVARAAPFVVPETRRGMKLSVRMTSAGRVGWISDRKGYRYEARHPSGVAWPEIPEAALAIWRAVSGVERAPDSCLVNYYAEGARMGMHQDRDEGELDWPVVSVSLGDAALFRVGGTERGGKTESVWVESGDVCRLAGATRLAFHGVDRVRPGSSTLLPDGGRINLTMRVVARGAR